MRKISLIAASCFLMLLPDTVFSEDFLSKENSMLLERLSEDKVISNSGIPNGGTGERQSYAGEADSGSE